MRRFSPTAFAVAFTVVAFASSSGGTLERRAPCTCPSFDEGYFPAASTSGLVGDTLRCYYPALSRCQYSPTTGELLRDTNYGLCRTSSSGSSCPSTDTGGYALGPGSGVYGGVLYCTYPTATERSSTRYYCDYTESGVLSSDNDVGLCASSATCVDSPSPVTSTTARTTTRLTTATTTRLTTTRLTTTRLATTELTTTRLTTAVVTADSTTRLTTIRVTTEVDPVIPTATKSSLSPEGVATATTTPVVVRNSNKRTIGIAVGVSLAAILLIASGIIAYILRSRNRRASRAFTTVSDASVLPTPQPQDDGRVDDRWQAGVPPREMYQNIHPALPPQVYNYQTTPSPDPGMNSDGRSWGNQTTLPPYATGPDPNMNVANEPWNQVTPPNSGRPLLYDNRAVGYNHGPEL